MDSETTPPRWKLPDEVMRLHRMKKRTLQFRFTGQENKSTNTPESSDKEKKFASRNPFKRAKTEPGAKFNADLNDDTTTDGTLFRLLNFSQQHSKGTGDESANTSFANAFAALNNSSSQKDPEAPDPLKRGEVFVDWTLRWRVRLMSSQPFPWNRKLKTCEEASGITGFVRCIDTDVQNNEVNLDTSPNARFHQCCLVWQHPYIPWLDLYPRMSRRSTGSSDLSVLPVKETLYNTWVDSFRSLFQLVRAKQCPYFYLIANTFVCLFRAAGINGYTEINASVTPTSRGFRQLLKEEDIDFTMPLKLNEKTKSPVNNDSPDTGYESLDMTEESSEKDTNDDDDTDEWLLETIGAEKAAIKQINEKQYDIIVGKEKITDSLPESLVFVEGVEAQALFNYLMNCKSIIPTSGPLAGVPPTLLSPVAFTGASLVPLKIKESMIRMQDENYHSIEIRGPMLPHMIHNLCDLMKNSSLEKFSMTFADIESSKPFTTVTACHMAGAADSQVSPVKTPRTPSVFGEQNLSDCGLKPKVLASFCNSQVKQFDSIQFSNNLYTCK